MDDNANRWGQGPSVPPPPSGSALPPAAFAPDPRGGASAPWQQAAGPSAYGQPGFGGAPVPAQRKQSRGWIVGIVVALCVCLVAVVGIGSCTALMTSSFGALGSSSLYDGADYLDRDSVAIIDMAGTIQYDGTTCSPEGLKAQLDTASDNPYIKAVVLRVDSGGGVSTAGEEMAALVRDFDKPIVVSTASLNASAAYEISSQADYIFVAKSSFVGAIGTLMQVTDLSGLMDKLGVSVDTITSADSKDSSYGYRPLTEEERRYYQDQVDEVNDQFVETVAEGRSMSEAEVRALATGLTFVGTEAVENGLADEIGYQDDAVAYAASLAGLRDYGVCYLGDYDSELGQLLDLLSESGASPSDTGLLAALPDDSIEGASHGTR